VPAPWSGSGETQMTSKSSGWGGARPGAGRPKGSGQGPGPNARTNRVAIMLTDKELSKLERLAKRRKKPVATVAYELLERGLSRSR